MNTRLDARPRSRAEVSQIGGKAGKREWRLGRCRGDAPERPVALLRLLLLVCRGSRLECPPVCIGVLVDERGSPLAQRLRLGRYPCGISPAVRREARGHLHDCRRRGQGYREGRAGAGNLARRRQLLEKRGEGEAGEHWSSVSPAHVPRVLDRLEELAQPRDDER
jgi:hypothetical protein